jgi:hypothetical protein
MSADNNDTSLAEFLRQEWKILLTIKPRLTMCIAFDKELKAVTRCKSFAIRNERFWNMFWIIGTCWLSISARGRPRSTPARRG